MDTRQSLVVEEDLTQTTDDQSSQSENVDKSTKVTTPETTSDKKKSLKDQMKDKAKKLKKLIGTKTSKKQEISEKKQKEVRIINK